MSTGVSSLSVGEIIHVQVAEKSGASRFILDAKNINLLVDSDFSLTKGEKLTVKVEQTSPNIVLRILNRDDVSSLMIRQHALNYQANSEALSDMFRMGREILNEKSLMALLSEKAKENIRNILKLMDASVLSVKSFQNPMFLKDYVSNLGLLLEYSLRKMIQGKIQTKDLKPEEGLKGILIKLSEQLQTQMMDGMFTGKEEGHKIDQLIKFAESSAKTIENHQLINISYRENSGNYVLQIPILCSEGIRTGELFIEIDKDGDRDAEGKKYNVIMFLNMDALGDVMVDASLKGNKITCLFKFDDPEAQNFFTSFLDNLKNNINGLGYDCGLLKCMTSKTINETREDYHRELFQDRCEINVHI